jgi:hypothetical protein
VFQDPATGMLFKTPLHEQSIPFTVHLTPDGLWRRFRTISQIAVMEGELLEVRL